MNVFLQKFFILYFELFSFFKSVFSQVQKSFSKVFSFRYSSIFQKLCFLHFELFFFQVQKFFQKRFLLGTDVFSKVFSFRYGLFFFKVETRFLLLQVIFKNVKFSLFKSKFSLYKSTKICSKVPRFAFEQICFFESFSFRYRSLLYKCFFPSFVTFFLLGTELFLPFR